METIVCPETSATNYALPRNDPEERSSHYFAAEAWNLAVFCCILLSTFGGSCTDCKKQSLGYFELAVPSTLHAIDI